MSEYVIKFTGERLGYGAVEMHTEPGNGIPKGVTAVCGENGSGKSTFGLILEKGRFAFGNKIKYQPETLKVKLITFSDIHSLSGMEVTYMNQRMESTMNEYVPTVKEIMDHRHISDEWEEECEKIGLTDIKEKKINYLSSGELRKLLIVNAVTTHPDLLVLDNPYIGLDFQAREEFNISLFNLSKAGMSVVLLVSDPADIPDFSDYLITLQNRIVSQPLPYQKALKAGLKSQFIEDDMNELTDFFKGNIKKVDSSFKTAFEIKNGSAVYGDKVIFRNLNWKVQKKECWRLNGRNGSGKSLLLSMINADNPQGYANDITLFDRKRGTGESIFEIKDRIGFVSPEMQLFFKSNDTVREIVVQGLRNSLNRYKPSSEEERELADSWLKLLGIVNLSERKFHQLSSGEQRLVLIARAFIKRPPLLILDEPFHGLDPTRKERIKKIINVMVKRFDMTLIFVSHYDEEVPECVTLTHNLLPGQADGLHQPATR